MNDKYQKIMNVLKRELENFDNWKIIEKKDYTIKHKSLPITIDDTSHVIIDGILFEYNFDSGDGVYIQQKIREFWKNIRDIEKEKGYGKILKSLNLEA